MKEEKKQMRRQGLAARRALTMEQRQEQSDAIAIKLLQTEAFQKAQTIFAYVSVEEEVHTDVILAASLAQGKTLAVPYITESAKGLMVAARLSELEDLTPGAFDILTVAKEKLEIIPAEAFDLIIVPGVAFDLEKHRIGMGGGYYDRFLADATKAAKVALAYDCQIFPALPVEPFDRQVDYIITEKKIF